ncbi:TlpA family protein disulfide reductase [Zavarzinella formosa]|uniref:TlpA family protein disulfide reductase n=1 Tax=Zavarzinella formosa TaxID=360055 RepID=UPI0002E4FA71|nr:TlpA disulfide reductase family protein [Zavarzinella formosa]
MLRYRIAAMSAIVALIPLVSDGQEKTDPAKAETKKELTREEQMKAIEKEFVEARKSAFKAINTAKTVEEREAGQKLLPQEKTFLPRLQAILAQNDGDEPAMTALAMSIFAFNTKDEKILAALDKNVKNPKIRLLAEVCIGGAPPAMVKVLERISKENPEKDVRGIACYAMAGNAFDAAEQQELPEGKSPDYKEAEALFARLEKEFGDVKIDKNTLADVAKGYLFEIRNLAVGMKAPAAASKNLKGEAVTLADLKGKVVVLDFWATWCGPCRAMIPHERELVERHKDKPFVFVSVSADDEKKDLEEFMKEEKMPWTHWWQGPDAPLLKTWNIRKFPTVYVLDTAGVIRHKDIRGESLDKAVKALLAETEKK